MPRKKKTNNIETQTDELDDEETMDAEEAQEGTVSREKELEILKQESEIPIEELLENLPPEMLEDRSEESGSEESDESPDEEESEPSKYELFLDQL